MFRVKKCNEKLCPLCQNESKSSRFQCNTNNVGYRWVCTTCKAREKTRVYEGETGRSGRVRGTEHIRDLKNKKKDSPLYKHKIVEHENEEAKFEMEITGKFRDALTRQANEAVRIYARPKTESLNSKNDFNHPPTTRVVVEKKSY